MNGQTTTPLSVDTGRTERAVMLNAFLAYVVGFTDPPFHVRFAHEDLMYDDRVYPPVFFTSRLSFVCHLTECKCLPSTIEVAPRPHAGDTFTSDEREACPGGSAE